MRLARLALLAALPPGCFYVEGRVGAAYQDAIFIENARDNSVVVPGGPSAFSNSGWVPAAAGLVGLKTPLTRYSTVGIEVFATQALRMAISPASMLQTAWRNQYGGLWTSVPLMLRGRF